MADRMSVRSLGEQAGVYAFAKVDEFADFQ
jgi:hypothetical protein